MTSCNCWSSKFKEEKFIQCIRWRALWLGKYYIECSDGTVLFCFEAVEQYGGSTNQNKQSNKEINVSCNLPTVMACVSATLWQCYDPQLHVRYMQCNSCIKTKVNLLARLDYCYAALQRVSLSLIMLLFVPCV